MSDDVTKFLEADIPDPTDFAADAPGLRQLDEALRCTMCRELFEAPVTVNCPHGHCFCSMVRPSSRGRCPTDADKAGLQCIRTAMATKDECPLCRHSILEVHLRKNPAIEDAVRAWNLARCVVCYASARAGNSRGLVCRPFVLQVLREREEAKAAPVSQVSSKYFSEKPKSKKRKRTPGPGSDDEVVEVGGASCRVLRPGSRETQVVCGCRAQSLS